MSEDEFRKAYRKLLNKMAKIDDRDLLSHCLLSLYKAPFVFPPKLKQLKRFKQLATQFSQLMNDLEGDAKELGAIACAEINSAMQQQGLVPVATESGAKPIDSSVLEPREALLSVVANQSTNVIPDTNETNLKKSDFVAHRSEDANRGQSTNSDLGGGESPQYVWERGRANSDIGIGRLHPHSVWKKEKAYSDIGRRTFLDAAVKATASRVSSEPTVPTEPSPQPEEPRFLNAGIVGHSKDAPLDIHKTYKLEFSVALERAREASASVRLPDKEFLFQKHEEEIELTIEVFSKDFNVAQSPMSLQVPRGGPSKNKACFDITPLKAGRVSLTATILKDRNFLFHMEISYSIKTTEVETKPASAVTHGRPLDAATDLKPREVCVLIHPVANGYDLTVWGGSCAKKVKLSITETELDDAINETRRALMEVINMYDKNQELVFQSKLCIDDDSQSRALHILARAGAMLFQRIFFGPLCGADIQSVGVFLRKQFLNSKVPLKLQVVSERFPIPWGMIYLGPVAGGAPLNWNLFLGMSHVIEQIPLQPHMTVQDSVIKSDDPSLAVSVNVHADIDNDMESDFVARQFSYWNNCSDLFGGRMQVTMRQFRAELLTALRDLANDQVMYLYCHAVTSHPDDPGGINDSHLVLTGGEQLSLGDMNLEAPMTEHLVGHPLIFINACESAGLSPSFYDGFVPYFMCKGARGVVGTECETPALFASEWALVFFPRFLAGEPIGELFLKLKRRFLKKYHNPLGLVYAVYCDGDTQVHPGLS